MQYQKLDVQIPVKDPNNGLLEVVKILRPSWAPEDIQDIKVGRNKLTVSHILFIFWQVKTFVFVQLPWKNEFYMCCLWLAPSPPQKKHNRLGLSGFELRLQNSL